MTRAWWPRAALRRDEDFDQHRAVSWLELFFDLVFVVIVARLAHDLAHHPDLEHARDFALLFAAVFWAWNAFTYYIERFESGGLENRLFVFAAMAASAAIAVWAESGLDEHYTGFAIALIATRLVNMVQWARAGIHVAEFRPVAVRFIAGFTVTGALLVGAMQLDGGARRWVFAVAVLIDIVTPLATLRLQEALPRLSTSKFPERFGLFTILVLGESVVGVVTGISELNESGELGGRQLAVGALGLAVGIGLWWTYFDFIARRPPKPTLAAALGWVYLHLVSLGAITSTGAAISLAASADLDTSLPVAAQRLLGVSVALALVGFGALELTVERRDDEPTGRLVSPMLKLVTGAMVAIACVATSSWNAAALLAVCVFALAVQAVYGAAVWYRPTNRQLQEASS